MLELLQIPILVVALVVISWAVLRLSSRAQAAARSFDIPPEVLRWQTDLKRLSQELQIELDDKMSAVSELSKAYEAASARLSDLILRSEELGEDLGQEQRRLSA